MNAPTILQMRSITKEFPGVRALSDVDLAVAEGEIHAIVGENGAGKSTLVRVLSGVHPAGTYTGDVVFRGQVRRFRDVKQSESAGIVIIHQELALVPELSITENIFLGSEIRRGPLVDARAARREARDLLARVGLRDDPDTPVKAIGVGKQQLVEIAKALHKDARLLILDEPTAALNDAESQQLIGLIVELKARGVASILISHKLSEIEQVADAITIIRDGAVVETIRAPAQRADEDRIIRGMVGRSLRSRFPDRTPQIGEVFFEVRGWTIRHPHARDRLVCKDASFRVRRGEIVGLAGLMGSGRTELAMSVFGRSYGVYVAGRIVKDGREIVLRTVADAIAHGLAYVSEDRTTLGLNLLDDVTGSIVAAKLAKLARLGIVDDRAARSVAADYRGALRITAPSLGGSVARLSGGNQQKVVLARSMFTDPDLLILDEPTRGIDVGATYEIYSIIQQLAAQGRGIVVISSELPELLGICDRVYTIFEGRITNDLPVSLATPENLMRSMTSDPRKAVG